MIVQNSKIFRLFVFFWKTYLRQDICTVWSRDESFWNFHLDCFVPELSTPSLTLSMLHSQSIADSGTVLFRPASRPARDSIKMQCQWLLMGLVRREVFTKADDEFAGVNCLEYSILRWRFDTGWVVTNDSEKRNLINCKSGKKIPWLPHFGQAWEIAD